MRIRDDDDAGLLRGFTDELHDDVATMAVVADGGGRGDHPAEVVRRMMPTTNVNTLRDDQL